MFSPYLPGKNFGGLVYTQDIFGGENIGGSSVYAEGNQEVGR